MLRTLLHRLGDRLRPLRRRLRGDAGMATAEYAVGTIAAVAFAAALLKVINSDSIRERLAEVIEGALQ